MQTYINTTCMGVLHTPTYTSTQIHNLKKQQLKVLSSPMPCLLVNITFADVLAKMSCSSIIFCTSPWKSLQVGHARITRYVY